MDKKKYSVNSLIVKHISKASEEAIHRVERRREGRQDYVKTRWNKLNSILLGGINFSSIYIIAGLMGTGKSYVRMLIQQDAFDQKINGKCEVSYVWLHFNFEMVASSEVMRLAGTAMGMSFYDLLSVEKKLEDENFERFKKILESLRDFPVYTCDVPGNVYQIYETIRKVAEKPGFENKQIIVSIDHTLLVQRFDEPDENRVMAELASVAIRVKKEFRAAVILLSQLKTTLQTSDRKKPENQYPIADDIFGSKTIPQAADFIVILHRPELLNLVEYGPEKYPTEGLLAFHIVKNRDGYPGLIRMKHDLSKGIIRQWEEDDDFIIKY